MYQTKTYNQLWNELIGEFGNLLPPEQARNIVRKAFLALCDELPWYFLMGEGYMVAPAAINTGSATFTRLSNQVTVDATLQAALDAMDLVLVTRMSIRVGNSSDLLTQIYQIYGWDTGTLTLTLDRPFLGDNQTVTPQIFRRFYLPPYAIDGNGVMSETSDFRSFIMVKPLTSPNRKRLIIVGRARELDQRDPERAITGEPTHIYPARALPATFPGVSATGPLYPGTPTFELWPYWTGNTEKVYQVLYQRRGDMFVDDRGSVQSVVPYPLDPELVLARAKMEASLWADRNKGNYPALAKTNWLAHHDRLQPVYLELYSAARRVNNDLVDNSFSEWETGDGIWSSSRMLDYDPQYAQTHATWAETWGRLG